MSAPPIISFKDVSKHYSGGFPALSGISLDVAKGDMVLVTGKSGAGKSTLLKLIAVIERATHGSVLVAGQNVSSMRQAAIPFLRRNLGLVLQDHKLLFDRSVFDNVMLPLNVVGESFREGSRRARAALDKVDLLSREKANPRSLSGGEQQRLCIARAVVNRPNILLIDEPTASLDRENSDSVLDIFRSFNQVGVTVLIATHDQALISQLQARVVTLSNGKSV